MRILADAAKPTIAAMLREHREDRDALLASLVGFLRDDPSVRAAWLWGSFGRGEEDDLSDLDPWLVVEDDAVGQVGVRLLEHARRTGTFLFGGESPRNGPPGGGFLSVLHEGRRGFLHVDLYWQPRSGFARLPDRAVILERLGEPRTSPSTAATTPRIEDATIDGDDPVEGGIAFAWTMLSIAAKTLARHADSDMALMAYPRPGMEEAATRLGLSPLAPGDWTIPERPLEKVGRLRALAAEAERLTVAARAGGTSLSPPNAACLNRYLDLVAAILG